MTYTLNRKGKALNRGLCGRKGKTPLFYNVKATATDCELDSDGFMVAHEEVAKKMAVALKDAKSCELGAIAAISELEEVFERIEDSMQSISVTVGLVYGDAHFTVTANY